MAYENETLRTGLKELLEANISDALDTVEAEYAATDPVTLPDPVTWHEGHNPEVLAMESSEFPYVAVLVGSRTPDRSSKGRAQWGYQEYDAKVFIDYFVVADDVATVNKIVHRYAKAIVAILQSQRYVEGFMQHDYEPEVKISLASRHPKTKEADMFLDADVDYIQAGQIIVDFEGTT